MGQIYAAAEFLSAFGRYSTVMKFATTSTFTADAAERPTIPTRRVCSSDLCIPRLVSTSMSPPLSVLFRFLPHHGAHVTCYSRAPCGEATLDVHLVGFYCRHLKLQTGHEKKVAKIFHCLMINYCILTAQPREVRRYTGPDDSSQPNKATTNISCSRVGERCNAHACKKADGTAGGDWYVSP
jgi:hypothetical protein